MWYSGSAMANYVRGAWFQTCWNHHRWSLQRIIFILTFVKKWYCVCSCWTPLIEFYENKQWKWISYNKVGQWKCFNITCVRDLVVSHCHCFIATCVVSHCHCFIALSLGISSHSEDHCENHSGYAEKRSMVRRRARGRGSPEVVPRARSLFLLHSTGHHSGHSLPPAHHTVVLPRCKMCACA